MGFLRQTLSPGPAATLSPGRASQVAGRQRQPAGPLGQVAEGALSVTPSWVRLARPAHVVAAGPLTEHPHKTQPGATLHPPRLPRGFSPRGRMEGAPSLGS